MIVVFGSLNMDMVMPVQAMPRPGETILCHRYNVIPGGKGANQAIAAARSGSLVKLFGAVGQDAFGQTILSKMAQDNIDISGVRRVDSPTGCAFICVDAKGESMVTVASGANTDAQEKDIPQALLGPQTTVVVQMETPLKEGEAFLERAHKAGARTILNLAPAQMISPAVFKYVSVLIVNQIEATVLALHLGFDVISPAIAAQRLATEYGTTCIVTLGGEGALACTPQGIWSINAMSLTPLDTTASGDAFVGVFAAALDQGKDMVHALRYAIVAGGLTCLTMGAEIGFADKAALKMHFPKVPLPQKHPLKSS